MTATGLALKGALWAQPQDNDSEALPLWKATLIALAVELLVPILVFGVDWSFLRAPAEPPLRVGLRARTGKLTWRIRPSRRIWYPLGYRILRITRILHDLSCRMS